MYFDFYELFDGLLTDILQYLLPPSTGFIIACFVIGFMLGTKLKSLKIFLVVFVIGIAINMYVGIQQDGFSLWYFKNSGYFEGFLSLFDPQNEYFFWVFLIIGLVGYSLYRATKFLVLCIVIGAGVPFIYDIILNFYGRISDTMELPYQSLFGYIGIWNDVVFEGGLLICGILFFLKRYNKAITIGIIAFIFSSFITTLQQFELKLEYELESLIVVNLYEFEIVAEVILVSYCLGVTISRLTHKNNKPPNANFDFLGIRQDTLPLKFIIAIFMIFMHLVISLMFSSYFLSIAPSLMFYVAIMQFDPRFHEITSEIKTIIITLFNYYLKKPEFVKSVFALTQIPQKETTSSKENINKNELDGIQKYGYKSFISEILPACPEIIEIEGMMIRFCSLESVSNKTTVDGKSMRLMGENLSNNFKGLTGEYSHQTKSIHPLINDNALVRELVLPSMPYADILHIFNNILRISSHYPDSVHFLVLSKKANPEFSHSIRRSLKKMVKYGKLSLDKAKGLWKQMEGKSLYRMRIFYALLRNDNLGRCEQIDSLLTSNIINLKGESGYCRNVNKILKFLINNGITPFGSIIIPDTLDFHYSSEELTLPRAVEAIGEKFRTVNMMDSSQKRIITIGKKIQFGSISKIDIPFDIDCLTQSMSIFGLTGTGKSNMLSMLLHKVHLKYPNIPQLIFCTKDHQELTDFYSDKVYSIGDEGFKIPWLINSGESVVTNQKLMQIAEYIGAGLGFLDNGVRYIYNHLQEIKTRGKEFPSRIEDLLNGVLRYLRDHPYGESQADIYRSISERVEAIIHHSQFCDIMELSRTIPLFLQDIMEGSRKIILNLVDFTEFEQKLIVMGILDFFQTYCKPSGRNLQRLIIIDESHNLFSAKSNNDPYDSENKSKETLEKKLSKVINQLGNTGTGLIFADQNPSAVFECIRKQIGTLALFRISYESVHLFSQEENFIKMISGLPNFQCWLQSGSMNVNFLMKTDKSDIKMKMRDQCELNPVISKDSVDEIDYRIEFGNLCHTGRYDKAYVLLTELFVWQINGILREGGFLSHPFHDIYEQIAYCQNWISSQSLESGRYCEIKSLFRIIHDKLSVNPSNIDELSLRQLFYLCVEGYEKLKQTILEIKEVKVKNDA